MQVEDAAAVSTSEQQAQLLQATHTTVTAALEQVATHGTYLCTHFSSLKPASIYSETACKPVNSTDKLWLCV